MPIEAHRLQGTLPAQRICPDHPAARNDFMRGQVQSAWRRLFGLPYCAVICAECKDIIGWEKPPTP